MAKSRKGSTVVVNFRDRKDLLEQLEKIAEKEERPLSRQIIYFLTKCVEDWYGISVKKERRS